jgi:hypothetical protein
MRRVRAKFTAMKVPRQCPLVLLVKVGWRGGKTFGREESIDEMFSRVPLHSIITPNSHTKPREAEPSLSNI